MIRDNLDGGGNIPINPSIVVRRTAAIGDSVAASVVADKLIEQGFEVEWQTHNIIHGVMRRHPRISKVTDSGGFCHVNLDRAYEDHPARKSRHFFDFFLESANRQLSKLGINLGPPLNCRPRLRVNEASRAATLQKFAHYQRPWTFICPRSDTYNVRQVPDGVWLEAADELPGTKFWVGRHPAPANIVDLKCAHFENVMDLMLVADLLITVDTGPMHVAAAMGIPVLAIGQSSSPELHLGDQSDFMTIGPSLDCLNCQKNLCPINVDIPPCQNVDPKLIASWAKMRLMAGESVSAVIPIFRPSGPMLNRCLEAVLPQVREVIITRERAGIIPVDIMKHPKIRHVMKDATGIGFGRNVNFGVRHSTGKYVLVLNDDLYLAPDAVSKMMEVMKPSVGVVGHLTRYPDGTIYHAGKPRSKDGGIGFPHIDLRQIHHTIREPMEMENTNGASILFRRQAYYDAAGYDEEFQFYAEDDDICLKVRMAGWKLWYTPLATGIHDEHQETKKVSGINEIMQTSNRRFGKKWAEYFRHNRNNRGIGNFNYLKR